MTIHRVEVIKYVIESCVIYVEAPPGVLIEEDGIHFADFDLEWEHKDAAIPPYCEIEEIPKSQTVEHIDFTFSRDENGEVHLS